jgi:cysteine-rich repeat protein
MRTSLAFAMAVVVAGAACGADPGSGDDDGPGPECGDGDVDPGEECDDGNDDRFDGCRPDCTAVDLIDPEPMVWTYFEIPGTRCIDGTPSGFSVNFNPDSDGLLIYLEGGGACFNSYCDSLFTWSGNTPGAGGIFDRSNAANPVGDWTMVYVPYCSGDIYGGDSEAVLDGELRQFRGYTNFTAFLERWVPSFAGIDQVVLSGASAGGFGAFTNFPQAQDAFGAVPVTLIDDSAPPLSSAVYPPCLQSTFREVWGLDGTLGALCGDACDDPDDFIVDYLDFVRARYPDLRGGVFSSLEDTTIRLFAGYGWYGGWNRCGELPSQVTGAVYTQGLSALRAHLVGGGDGFGTYFVPGAGHTILRSQGFYTTQIRDTTPAQWVGAAIAGEASHLGP